MCVWVGGHATVTLYSWTIGSVCVGLQLSQVQPAVAGGHVSSLNDWLTVFPAVICMEVTLEDC